MLTTIVIQILAAFSALDAEHGVWAMFWFVLILEVPFFLFIILGVLRSYLSPRVFQDPPGYLPKVSCVLVCYNEGESIIQGIKSLVEQDYQGEMELLVIIDGAKQNQATVIAAESALSWANAVPRRSLKVLKKMNRSGRTSTNNLGLKLATGELLVMIDGDVSCRLDMVRKACRYFADPNKVALAGALRVRNEKKNWLTRLQSLEYMLNLRLARTGFNEFEQVVIISGALGVFRRDFIEKIGGWSSGSSEDLDLTLRINSYIGRYPELSMSYANDVVAYTDAPETVRILAKQRLRWDGDLFFIYCRRHWRQFSPKTMGWRSFLLTIWGGLLFEMVLPFTAVFCLTVLLFTLPLTTVAVLISVMASYYFLTNLLFFGLYILAVSDERLKDLSMLALVPVMPFYSLVKRFWSCYALLCEIVLKTHLDTSLAPWWVIRARGGYAL